MPTENPDDQKVKPDDPTKAPDAPLKADDTVPPVDEKHQEELNQAKTRESAARKKMDETQIENKKLREENDRLKNDKPEEPPKPITKAELDEALWTSENRQDIDLYKDDEYNEDIDLGVPKEKALRYAKLRHATLDDSVKSERQKAMSSPSSTNRTLPAEDEIVLTAEQKRRGITKEMITKYKADIERMG